MLQFFGIVNLGNKSNMLIGPFENEKVTLLKLQYEVKKLMENPATELLVNEDSAAVYELVDKELIQIKNIDIAALLEEED